MFGEWNSWVDLETGPVNHRDLVEEWNLWSVLGSVWRKGLGHFISFFGGEHFGWSRPPGQFTFWSEKTVKVEMIFEALVVVWWRPGTPSTGPTSKSVSPGTLVAMWIPEPNSKSANENRPKPKMKGWSQTTIFRCVCCYYFKVCNLMWCGWFVL